HRDVRTSRRWETERGLPVHRIPGGRKPAVYASRSEIDSWLDSAESVESHIPAEPPGKPGPDVSSKRGAWYRRSMTRSAGLILALSLALVFAAKSRIRPAPLNHLSVSDSTLVAWDVEGRRSWTYEFNKAPRTIPPMF